MNFSREFIRALAEETGGYFDGDLYFWVGPIHSEVYVKTQKRKDCTNVATALYVRHAAVNDLWNYDFQLSQPSGMHPMPALSINISTWDLNRPDPLDWQTFETWRAGPPGRTDAELIAEMRNEFVPIYAEVLLSLQERDAFMSTLASRHYDHPDTIWVNARFGRWEEVQEGLSLYELDSRTASGCSEEGQAKVLEIKSMLDRVRADTLHRPVFSERHFRRPQLPGVIRDPRLRGMLPME